MVHNCVADNTAKRCTQENSMSHSLLKLIFALFRIFPSLFRSFFSIKKSYICSINIQAQIFELRSITQNMYYRHSNNSLNSTDQNHVLNKLYQLKNYILDNCFYIKDYTYQTLNFMIDNTIFSCENNITNISQILHTLNMMYFLTNYIK